MKYLSPEQVLFIHSRLIDTTGGLHGIRDISLLQSAVSRPKATFEGKDLYPDLFHKTTALMESLACNHPFIDGNKRTAITASGIFLNMNGYKMECSSKELERFALSVAQGRTVQRCSKMVRKIFKKKFTRTTIDLPCILPCILRVLI